MKTKLILTHRLKNNRIFENRLLKQNVFKHRVSPELNLNKLLPILTIFALAGCGGQDADQVPTPVNVNTQVNTTAPAPQDIGSQIGFTFSSAATKAAFNPIIRDFSVPSFLLFSDSTDGTASVAQDEATPANPVVNALNDLTGWSTNAPKNFHFNGQLDEASPCSPYTAATGGACIPNVFLIPLNVVDGADPRDPSQIDTSSPTSAVNQSLLQTTQFRASVANLEAGNDSLRLSPITPLASRQLYLLAVTNGVLDDSSQPVGPSPTYELLSDTTPEQYNLLPYPETLDSLRTLIQGSEQIAVGTINSVYTAAGIGISVDADDIVHTQLFTTNDPTTPLNALAHPGLANEALAPLATALPDQFANARLNGFYSNQLLKDQFELEPQQIFFTSEARLVQGAIRLPYYLNVPDGSASLEAQAQSVQSSIWRPSDSVAQAIGQQVPNDTDIITTEFNGTRRETSQNVTYSYPFPEKTADVVAPVTVVLPEGEKPVGGWPVVVMVHGITQERSSLLLLASALADACNDEELAIQANCFASVMIDLPLHGHQDGAVNPILDQAGAIDPTALATLDPALASIQERHFGITYNAAGDSAATRYLPMASAPSSGSLFINLSNFQNTRDHFKQAVMDQLNVLASLGSMDVDGISDNGADFNTEQVYLAGHSLGGIIGLTTTAVANAGVRPELPRIQASAFLNSGGQMTRLLENSPNTTFGGPAILAGLAAAGLEQNTRNYENYFNVFQAIIDEADPVNYAQQLTATQTPSYFAEIVGDGTEGSSDQTVPVGADNNPIPPLGNAQPAPLAGTRPLTRLANTVTLSEGDYTAGNNAEFNGAAADAPKQVVVRFEKAMHSTAVLPSNPIEALTLQDMANHLSTFFTLNGRGLDVTNASNSVN